MGGLAGKRALVTGGSRGIGAAIVRRLAAEGASVVINYRSNAGAARALAAELDGDGRRVSAKDGLRSCARRMDALLL